VPCEGGVPPLKPQEVQASLCAVPAWRLTANGRGLRRDWRMKDFATALEFINRVGQLAEQEGHHPDLHLTGYRQVAIEVSTHAVGGLTENDFILAARIDTIGL
jgi:4a-hydroxytetrahydrobiopterin dehydratase